MDYWWYRCVRTMPREKSVILEGLRKFRPDVEIGPAIHSGILGKFCRTEDGGEIYAKPTRQPEPDEGPTSVFLAGTEFQWLALLSTLILKPEHHI